LNRRLNSSLTQGSTFLKSWTFLVEKDLKFWAFELRLNLFFSLRKVRLFFILHEVMHSTGRSAYGFIRYSLWQNSLVIRTDLDPSLPSVRLVSFTWRQLVFQRGHVMTFWRVEQKEFRHLKGIRLL
jgi:hypothetical protein